MVVVLIVLYIAVAFARLFFPSEAKLAMDIAHAETTSEFARLAASKGSSGNFREVDLNETPIVQKKRLYSRMEALMKTGNSCLFDQIMQEHANTKLEETALI